MIEAAGRSSHGATSSEERICKLAALLAVGLVRVLANRCRGGARCEDVEGMNRNERIPLKRRSPHEREP